MLHPSGMNGGNSGSIRNSHISSSSSSNSGAIQSDNPSIGHASDLYGGVRGCSFASNDGGKYLSLSVIMFVVAVLCR